MAERRARRGSVDYSIPGGFFWNGNFDLCRECSPLADTFALTDMNELIMSEEPGPGWLAMILCFIGAPCMLLAMLAWTEVSCFVFSTEDGKISCTIDTKSGTSELPQVIIPDIHDVRICVTKQEFRTETTGTLENSSTTHFYEETVALEFLHRDASGNIVVVKSKNLRRHFTREAVQIYKPDRTDSYSKSHFIVGPYKYGVPYQLFVEALQEYIVKNFHHEPVRCSFSPQLGPPVGMMVNVPQVPRMDRVYNVGEMQPVVIAAAPGPYAFPQPGMLPQTLVAGQPQYAMLPSSGVTSGMELVPTNDDINARIGYVPTNAK